MLISMWNIYNALGYEDMTPMIQDGRPTAHDVRLIASAYLDETKIYVGHAGDYFESEEDDTLIVHRKDMILVRGVDIANVFNELCVIVERFDAWALQLESLSKQEAPLQEMVDASNAIIRAPLFLYAPDGCALALSSSYPPDTHPHWAALIRDEGLTEEGMRFLKEEINLPSVFMDKRPTRRSSARALPGTFDYIHCSLFPQGYMAAHMVCFGFEKALDQGTEHLAGELCRHMTAHMELHFSSYSPLSKLTKAFGELLAGDIRHEDEACALMRAIGWNPKGPFDVVCVAERVSNEGEEQVLLPRLARQLSSRLHQVVFVWADGNLIAIRNGREVGAELPLNDSFAAGYSIRFTALRACRGYHLQARHELQRCLYERLPCSFASDHQREGVAECLSQRVSRELGPTYAPICLHELQAYDDAHGTCYYHTLRAYCLSGFHPAMAAQLLGVHRNSFSYRFDRMREITDLAQIEQVAAAPTFEAIAFLNAVFLIMDIVQGGPDEVST